MLANVNQVRKVAAAARAMDVWVADHPDYPDDEATGELMTQLLWAMKIDPIKATYQDFDRVFACIKQAALKTFN